jgi:BirA family biotin operon repressor/biotin-[acetyl-CoA-carboxylase] ligase
MLGKEIIHLKHVDSTSNYIATLQKAGELNPGVVVLSDIQEKGRGQRGTLWQSEGDKNLTFSFYLTFEKLKIENQVYLNQFISLIVVELLSKYHVDSKIKWPNDILIGSKKIAGILIENQIQGAFIKSSIIGIGINLNQTIFSNLNATSLKSETKKDIDKLKFLDEFISIFNQKLINFQRNELKLIYENYLSKLWLKDTLSRFESNGITFEGIIKGTDCYGRLEIDIEGEKKYFGLKEITFLERNS